MENIDLNKFETIKKDLSTRFRKGKPSAFKGRKHTKKVIDGIIKRNLEKKQSRDSKSGRFIKDEISS